MIHTEYFTFNAFQERCTLAWDDNRSCVIADPGCLTDSEISRLVSFIDSKGLTPVCIMLTHCHFDHIYGMAPLAKKYSIPVYAHPEEMYTLEQTNPYVCQAYGLPLPSTFPIIKTQEEEEMPSTYIPVTEGDTIKAGSMCFEVFETPGHTTGGVCFLERNEKILISGDTLFAGSIGRTDHPGGDYDALMKGIFEKLLMLDGDVKIIPGHGPESDIATERMTNPFLLPFNEPYED